MGRAASANLAWHPEDVAHPGSTTRTPDPEVGEVIVHHLIDGGEIVAASNLPQPADDGSSRASNRSDGSRSESGKPAGHIGAIGFIVGSEVLAERRLLIGNDDNVKKEPEQRAVAEEIPVSE
jgi:hypothetical protein